MGLLLHSSENVVAGEPRYLVSWQGCCFKVYLAFGKHKNQTALARGFLGDEQHDPPRLRVGHSGGDGSGTTRHRNSLPTARSFVNLRRTNSEHVLHTWGIDKDRWLADTSVSAGRLEACGSIDRRGSGVAGCRSAGCSHRSPQPAEN
jgi:hypothetical protein